MPDELIKIDDHTQALTLSDAGQIANQLAGMAAWKDYQARLAQNTRDRQENDLALFAAYLTEKGLQAGDFYRDPEAWRGVTWGLVDGFIKWLRDGGYAIATLNVRLATLKAYCRLAVQAETLGNAEYARIQTIKSYRRIEGRNIDEERTAAGIPTRRLVRWVRGENAFRKAAPTPLTEDQAKALKKQPDTPQGRRDALLIGLLLDLGLRVGELARLQVGDFDLKAGELRFYRPKVNKVQTHSLKKTEALLSTARAYLVQDAPVLGSIWRASASKLDGKAMTGQLTHQGMGTRALTERVRVLGARVGVKGLSAHDLRHYWATQAALHGTPIERLKEAGGWTSLVMPDHYIEAARIANEGVKLK